MFFVATSDYPVSNKIHYGALDSVRTFRIVIAGSKSSKRKSEPHPWIQPPCYIHLQSRRSSVIMILVHCSFFARGTLWASKNNHGSSQLCSRQYRVSGLYKSKIKKIYILEFILDSFACIRVAQVTTQCMIWPSFQCHPLHGHRGFLNQIFLRSHEINTSPINLLGPKLFF